MSDFTNKEYLTVLHDRPKYIPTCSSLGLSTPVSGRTGSHGTLTASRPDPITLTTGNVYNLLQSLNGNAHIIILGPVRMVIYHRTYFAFPSSNASQFLQGKKNLIQYHPRNPQNSPTTQSLILTASSLTGRGRIKLTKNLK